MLEFLFVVMAQAAAGAPATTPPPPASPPAVEAPAQPSTEAAAEAPQPDVRDIVRCRRVAYTGSRLGSRRCTTLREDDAQRQNAREETEGLQRTGAAAWSAPTN
jgi:hypothetical protein